MLSFGGGAVALAGFVPGVGWAMMALQAHRSRIVVRGGSLDMAFGRILWWRGPIRATFHRGEYRIVCDMRMFALWFTDLVQVASSATAKPVGTLGILFRRREWDLVLAQLREGQAEAEEQRRRSGPIA